MCGKIEVETYQTQNQFLTRYPNGLFDFPNHLVVVTCPLLAL